MEKLSPNWITTGTIDFEYKKYVLLAYLQQVAKQFDAQKLYPVLTDLLQQHQHLSVILKNKESVEKQLPKNITKIDVQNFTIAYERTMNDPAYINEITQIINFSLPLITEYLTKGKAIYNNIEQNMHIEPIGIVPLTTDSGYLLLTNGQVKNIHAYTYEVSIFTSKNDNYRSIKTKFITHYTRGITFTYESMKLDLVKKHGKFSNPAAFLVQTNKPYPYTESFLPVAKRSIMRYLAEFT